MSASINPGQSKNYDTMLPSARVVVFLPVNRTYYTQVITQEYRIVCTHTHTYIQNTNCRNFAEQSEKYFGNVCVCAQCVYVK